MNAPAPVRQRLDKWLWFARVVKSRTLAAKLVTDGHVRVNGLRVDAPAKAVGLADVVTVALDRNVRILRVRLPGERRGPFPEACLLFENLTPPPDQAGLGIDPEERREPGSGRPTKKQQRQIARLKTPEY